MPSPVQIDGVRHTFKGAVGLDGLTASIPSGICGLLGPNGAGKTTLMRLLATIYTPQQGRISVAGNDLGSESGRKAARTVIGYLPQAFGFYPNFTVSEFVEYFAIMRGVTYPHVSPAVSTALARVDMTNRATTKMKALSGGMIRRVGIAQAIAHEPHLLILDEPTAGLDPDQRHQLRLNLHELAQTTTILISTHLAEDIAALGGNVLVLNEGTLRFQGTAAALTDLGAQLAAADRDMRTPIERGYSVAQQLPPVRPGDG